MSIIADVLGGGALGALFGGLQRVIEKKMDTAFKIEEFSHIREMHKLSQEHEMRMARQELMVAELNQQTTHTQATFDHDISFKPSTWVDNIRALVRPVLTCGVLYMAYDNPYVHGPLASAVIMWWFSSRVKIN